MGQRVANIINRPKLSKIGAVRLGVKGEGGKMTEVNYFVLDIQDKDVLARAQAAYGKEPATLDIAFFSDDVNDVYSCTYQKWSKSVKGTPILDCEGNGVEAVDMKGQHKTCPCPELGKKCNKVTVIKFLLPKVSMGGYFMLSTRSEHNARVIDTTIQLVSKATGGLTMRMLKMNRVEGFITVNGMKTKKQFISLVWDKGIDDMQMVDNDGGTHPLELTHEESEMSTPNFEDCATEKSDGETIHTSSTDMERIIKGRAKVKEKLHEIVNTPEADKALEAYACRKYGVETFDMLSIDNLLDLWHSLAVGNGAVEAVLECQKAL